MSNSQVILLLLIIWLVARGKWVGMLTIGFISSLKRFAEENAVREWQGNYYQWGNQHIRIVEENGCIWVVDEDLINAVGMELDKGLRRKLEISYSGYGNIPGTKHLGFTEKAVLEFLHGKQERNPEIIKLKLWFEREVFFTLRRKMKSVC